MRRSAVSLLAATVAAVTTVPAGAQRSVRWTPAPSTHPAVTAARSAQTLFERGRRHGLRYYNGGGTERCEEWIGRLCYWNNNDDLPPPEERPVVARDREALLDGLARAAEAAPDDDWIAGQRVRYLAEARRLDEAVAVADACSGTPWWCDALRGVARHGRGDHALAAGAFDRALAAMPADQRCAWTDLSLWLDLGGERDAYRKLGCGPARDAWERRFWLVAQPLWLLPANDLRHELLARRVMAAVHARSANPYSMTWGDDLTEIEVRYGWPTAWSARPGSAALGAPETRVVGHEPTPSYDFVPAERARRDPLRAAGTDWDLGDPRARVRYAPRYARRGVVALEHEIARFRRGDSTLVVGAWNVARDAAWDSAGVTLATLPDSLRRVDVALVAMDSTGAGPRVVGRDVPRRGAVAVTVGAEPRLVGLEVLDTARARAARARYAVAPLAADVRLSDLLLLTRGVGAAPELDSVLPHARGASTVEAGGVLGLYWESYVAATPDAPATVSVRATRLDTRLVDRARSALGIGARVTPVAVRFTDIGRPDGRPGRSLVLNWPSVPAGAYRLELTVERDGETATVSRTVRVAPR